MNTTEVSSNQAVTIIASYIYNDITKEESKDITIKDIPPPTYNTRGSSTTTSNTTSNNTNSYYQPYSYAQPYGYYPPSYIYLPIRGSYDNPTGYYGSIGRGLGQSYSPAEYYKSLGYSIGYYEGRAYYGATGRGPGLN